VAAVPGQVVCRQGLELRVDGARIALARWRDRRGRELPDWQGCRPLGAREVFLLAPHPDSLDGRYFGPTPRRFVLGRAVPLATWSGS
jgi:type IV secretory pathway protease TraF